MQFTTGDTLSRCNGSANIHFFLDVTVGSVTRQLKFTLDDLQGEPPESIEEARREVLARLRSAAKESGATNFQQLRTALENKTFRI